MKVEIYSLYIGQGTANFIQVEKSDKTKIFILIDFGSAKASGINDSDSGLAPTTGNAKLTIENMLSKANKNMIDILILSHLDTDHYNLIHKLDKKIKFGKVIIGGSSNKVTIPTDLTNKKSIRVKGKFGELLKDLKARGTNDISALSITNGFSDKSSAIKEIKDKGAVLQLRLLCQRAFKGKDINDNSSVVALLYEYQKENVFSAIFPGDATYVTIEHLTKLITKGSKLKTYKALTEAEERYLVIPHHGSYQSLCDGGTIDRNKNPDLQLKGFEKFINLYPPNNAYVSAHFLSTFNHPVKQVFKIVECKCDDCIKNNYNNIVNKLSFCKNKQKTLKYEIELLKKTKCAVTSVNWKTNDYKDKGNQVFYDLAVFLEKSNVLVEMQYFE